ncbi:MAG: AraC family transcriptional regulator [Thermodesulfobacteriota bacterium]
MEDMRKVFASSIARLTFTGDQLETAIPTLSFYRLFGPMELKSHIYEPCVCLIAQGAKRVLLGADTYVYDSRNFLISSLHLPTSVQIIKASREKPYMGLMLKLDLREISRLMAECDFPPSRLQQPSRGLVVGEVTLPLLNAFQRLIDLLSEPMDIPILAPIIQREIIYRLLVSDQGARLRHIVSEESRSREISQAIDWLRNNFTQQLHIDDLAAQVHMSTSTFHHHFKALTAISPLQFQKRLRLNEARRLMLAERIDSGTAAFRVGYESQSQFSREYSRLFGEPPLRDITKLRRMADPVRL